MAVTQYIGARYVPVFANPPEWDAVRTYEPLTIVSYKGDSYTSRQYVPSQIDISNEDYWVETGNYNAQVEAYRLEVIDYKKIIDKYKDDTDAIIAALREEVQNVHTDINRIDTSIAEEKSTRKSEDDKIASSVTQLASDTKSVTDGLTQTDTQLAKDIATNSSNISKHSILIAREDGHFRHLIFLGDSWGNGYSKGASHPDKGLAQYLADDLGAKLTNASVNGAGFVRGGDYNRNFKAQWDAISSIDKQDADIIVIAGGQNDFGVSVSDMVSSYLNLYDDINLTKAPDARVYVFPYMLSRGRTFAGTAVGSDVPEDVKAFMAVMNYSTEFDTHVCRACYRWCSIFGDEDIDDAWHLTAEGYKRYAEHMYDFILTGNENWPYNYAQLMIPSDLVLDSYRNNEVYEIDGNVTVRFAARTPNEIVGSHVLATIGSNMAYGHVFYTPAGYDIPNFISWDVGVGSDGITYNTLQIQGDANIPAGTWFFLNVTYPASL